jgi:hypothetical protein
MVARGSRRMMLKADGMEEHIMKRVMTETI